MHEIHDEILDFGRIALRKHFFGDHPFSSNSLGTVETVCNINRSSQRELYKNLIRGSNAVLVISGDFEPEVDLPKLEKLLLRIPEAPFKKQSLPFIPPTGPVDVQEHMEREQAVVFEAYPDTGLSPEKEIVGSVLDELLSDMSGPLFRSVREDQSLAYYVGSSRTLGYDYGCFYLYAGTQPSSTSEVLECFDKEMNRIRNGQVTEEELQAAVTRLKIQNRFSLQTPSGRATRVALNALYEKPLMDWLEFENRLNALTIKDLTTFASDYFRPEQRLRLIVSPK